MKYSIDPQVLSNHPDIMVGLLIVRNAKNGGSPAEVMEALRQAESSMRNELDLETYRDHPHIASLREIHRAFGNNPNKFPPSVQALIKRVLKGSDLPSITILVDLYNIISLRHIVSAGGEDLDAMEGDFRLTYATGDEVFVALGETGNSPPAPGEIVYCDDKGVICGKLDWREAERTKLTEETKNAVLVLEVCEPVTKEQLQGMLQELQALVEKFAGGSVEQVILSAVQPAATV